MLLLNPVLEHWSHALVWKIVGHLGARAFSMGPGLEDL